MASSRKPCQTYVVTSMEKTFPTGVLSLLPAHTPTARAYAPSLRAAFDGAAM